MRDALSPGERVVCFALIAAIVFILASSAVHGATL